MQIPTKTLVLQGGGKIPSTCAYLPQWSPAKPRPKEQHLVHLVALVGAAFPVRLAGHEKEETLGVALVAAFLEHRVGHGLVGLEAAYQEELRREAPYLGVKHREAFRPCWVEPFQEVELSEASRPCSEAPFLAVNFLEACQGVVRAPSLGVGLELLGRHGNPEVALQAVGLGAGHLCANT